MYFSSVSSSHPTFVRQTPARSPTSTRSNLARFLPTRPTPARPLVHPISHLQAYLPSYSPTCSQSLAPAMSHVRYCAFSLDAHRHVVRHSSDHHTTPPFTPLVPPIHLSDRHQFRPSARHAIVYQPTHPPASLSTCPSTRPTRPPMSVPSRLKAKQLPWLTAVRSKS